MPELPEVETVCRDLRQAIVGRRIAHTRIFRDRILVSVSRRGMAPALHGREILGVTRRGKAILIELSGGRTLIVHLRMTGQLCATRERRRPEHTRAVWEFEDGGELRFVDVRCLGTLELIRTADLAQAITLRNIGPDVLAFGGRLQSALSGLLRRRSALKSFLLNQKHLAGIGNIYASEIMYRARLHPDTVCCELTAQQVRRLGSAIQRVLREAIRYRGTTISDYRAGNGKPGNYQSRLRGRGCPGVIVRMVHNNRSTYVCPVCQPERSTER